MYWAVHGTCQIDYRAAISILMRSDYITGKRSKRSINHHGEVRLTVPGVVPFMRARVIEPHKPNTLLVL